MLEWNGYIKGVNLGGWLSQCNYTEEHSKKFITEDDISKIAKWGFDHIRLPIDYDVIEETDDPNRAKGFTHIDNAASWCGKYGLNLIIDLHKTAGYAFYTLDSNNLFENEALQDKFIEIWKTLAERYSYLGESVAFELLNEVVEQDSVRWNKLIIRAVSEIRKIAPKTKIIIGGINWSSVHTLSLLEKPDDENIIYTFHFYEPFLFTHQKARWIKEMPGDIMKYPATFKEYQDLSRKINSFGSGLFGSVNEMGTAFMAELFKEAVEAAEKAGVPLYCGEYGVIDNAPAEDTGLWYADINAAFKQFGIGRALWTYKGMSFGIADNHYDICRDMILKHI